MKHNSPEVARTEAGSESDVPFNIEARELPAALDTYSAVSGVSVVCDSGLARGRISNAISGVQTAQEALTALLRDTGLAAVFTDRFNAIIVLDPSAVPVAYGSAPEGTVVGLGSIHVDALPVELEAPAASRGSGGLYAYLVKYQLERALRQNGRMGGHFEIRMRIWVDSAGVVQRSEVIRSSAAGPLENIRHALEKLSIGQPPPPDLPQPVTIHVAVWER